MTTKISTNLADGTYQIVNKFGTVTDCRIYHGLVYINMPGILGNGRTDKTAEHFIERGYNFSHIPGDPKLEQYQ